MISKIGKLCLCLLFLCSLIATPAESATNCDWVQTGGGCYTANVVFSEVQEGLAYTRTDVGGAYRWDSATSQWVFLLNSTSWAETHLNGVLSVAASPQNANKVPLACVGLPAVTSAARSAPLLPCRLALLKPSPAVLSPQPGQ